MTQLSHRIRLYPNASADLYFRKACGISRFAYNWALAEWNEKYEAGEKEMSGYSIRNRFNEIKHKRFPWVTEVTKWAAQKGIENLGNAFKRFFKKKFPHLDS